MTVEETNKAIEILEDKIDELEKDNGKLGQKVEEYEKLGFDKLIETNLNYNNLKSKVIALRNAIGRFETELEEQEDKTDNMTFLQIIKEFTALPGKSEERKHGK